MSVAVPVKRIDHEDQLYIVTITISSPTRLGSGGRAKLARVAINHHVPMRGRTNWAPRIKIIVRL